MSSGAKQCLFCSGLQCPYKVIDTCRSDRAFCSVNLKYYPFNILLTLYYLNLKKMITTTGNIEVYVKRCMDACIDNRVVNLGHSTVTQYCCNEDLCNGSQHKFEKTNFLLYFILFMTLNDRFFN